MKTSVTRLLLFADWPENSFFWPIRSGQFKRFWKWFDRSKCPGARLDLKVNFHLGHFIDPTNSPWASEDGSSVDEHCCTFPKKRFILVPNGKLHFSRVIIKILKGKLTIKFCMTFRRLHVIIVECGEINIKVIIYTEEVYV